MESTLIETLVQSYQQKIKELEEKVEHLSESKKQPSRSTEINELATSLAKAQAEIKVAGLNAQNPFFKSSYADLAEIVKASRPALTKNGLAVVQPILPGNDGQTFLHTVLTHSTGQWIESRMEIVPQKTDIQSLGKYITYLRRYCYAALIGVVASGDDDDGESLMVDERRKNEPISKQQLEQMERELDGHPTIAQRIKKSLQIQSLSEFPKLKFEQSIELIRKIKKETHNSQ